MKLIHAVLAAALMGLTAPSLASAGDVTPDVIFGSGNANGSWTIDQANGVELGLRAKLRHNASGLPENTFNWDGVDTYTFSAGVAPTQSFPTAVWSFEWSINTDFDGSSGFLLDDLTFVLETTSVASGATFSFDPINVSYADHAIGTNATGNGGGSKAPSGDDAAYANLIANNNVAQNSWKPSWFIVGFDPTTPGDYVFSLQAYNGTQRLAATQMTVTVAAVPLPPAAWMGLGLLGGLGVLRRARRRRGIA